MSLSRRLQVLIDADRYRRLEEHAARRGTSVASVVREAIDQLLPDEQIDRRRAAQLLLAARPMDVGDWDDVKRQMIAEMSRENATS